MPRNIHVYAGTAGKSCADTRRSLTMTTALEPKAGNLPGVSLFTPQCDAMEICAVRGMVWSGS